MTSLSADSRGLDPAKKAALIEFREDFFASLSSWGDALFELTDAVLCSRGAVRSVPSLSLEPVFRRSHGSVYKALARGEIDTEALRQALADARPADWPLIFAIDTSTWDRCDAETSPERGFYYSASKHSAGQPIVAGWSYQWICQLGWDPDSWTAPLDATRIPPTADSTQATIDQVRTLVDRLPDDRDVPMFVLDAGYDPIALTDGLADTRAQVLVRIRSDRVFYGDPSKRDTARAGRPRPRPPFRPIRPWANSPPARGAAHPRLPLRIHHRPSMAELASKAGRARPVGRRQRAPHRARHCHPRRR